MFLRTLNITGKTGNEKLFSVISRNLHVFKVISSLCSKLICRENISPVFAASFYQDMFEIYVYLPNK